MEIKVVVGSQNPVKIRCTQLAFQSAFPDHTIHVIGISAPSGVSDQPASDAETLRGANNRAVYCKTSRPEADYWVGIEGGITDSDEKMDAFAWVSILSGKKEGQAKTATFQLPPKIRSLVLEGMELGAADDLVFNRKNSKQSNGAVGILTHDLIDRVAYYEPAVVLALIPFLNPDLY